MPGKEQSLDDLDDEEIDCQEMYGKSYARIFHEVVSMRPSTKSP